MRHKQQRKRTMKTENRPRENQEQKVQHAENLHGEEVGLLGTDDADGEIPRMKTIPWPHWTRSLKSQ